MHPALLRALYVRTPIRRSHHHQHPPPQIDWEKAAADYGAASVESYKKGMQNTAKKIKKAMDSGVQPEAADAAAEGTPAKGKVGRKRKEKPVVESEGEGGEERRQTDGLSLCCRKRPRGGGGLGRCGRAELFTASGLRQLFGWHGKGSGGTSLRSVVKSEMQGFLGFASE